MESLDLSDFFKTKLEANDFSSRLAAIVEKLYQTDFNLEKALLDQFGITIKDKFVIFLRDNNISTESNTALIQFFDSLQEKIAAMPVMSITLAFEPKELTLQALSQWFVLNLNKQVLFDFKIDPHLIAGAAIAYNGKHADFSIRSTFERIYNESLGVRG